MLSVLGEKLHDNRFLRLLKYLLKAGYMEDWHYGRTLSGTPQGSVVSPILANVYLDRLDRFVETVLIPSTHPRHSPKGQPSVECVEGPNGVPEGIGGTTRWRRNCASRCNNSRQPILMTLDSAGSDTFAMQTTSCWASAGQKPKPSR